ncbi:MAG: DNA polymerase III subunit delta [Bacteroidia bacterium]|nr:DNA polymerase III subunit delta [Bacteroidia bacterium]
MSFDEILNELKNRIFRPVYFLMGDEPYYIDEISSYITDNVLNEQEKDFNQTILYGKETDVISLLNVTRRFPMMASHQVVVVREAQSMKGIDGKSGFSANSNESSSIKKDNPDPFLLYVENPLRSTVLVINYKYGSLDKRTKLYKSIEKNGVLFESKKLYDNQVAAWISQFASNHRVSIAPDACQLLSEYLGNDLSRIANEINKLVICLPDDNKMITSELIEQNIGISKEYNVFELQKSLSTKDILKANRISNYFADNPKDNPFMLTLTSLFSFFSRLLIYHQLKDKSRKNASVELGINIFFMADYEIAAKKYPENKVIQVVSLIREYDLKNKGVNNMSTGEGDLLKELIFRILH